MQIRKVALIATVVLALPLISISSAAADNKTPAPSTQKSISPNAAYIAAFDAFRKDVKVYEDQRREINKIFKEAIDKALANAKANKSVPQTQMQKRQSMNAKQQAIITATLSRDSAIEALGAPPVAPTPPAKIPSVAKNKSQQREKSPTPKTS
jgi:hypothetical protein